MKETHWVMKTKIYPLRRQASLVAGLVLIGSMAISLAFPPVPHHRFYGMVRDEYGNPIQNDNAEIIFETTNQRVIRSPIVGFLPAGSNYRLDVPMDAGLTSKLHKPTAMRPEAPFRIRVRIGDQVFLPIEVATQDGSYMGRPGGRTKLDLTLGEDLDGDGMPDAWEESLLRRLGLDDLADVDPNADSDGDGLSNLQEYISGSYAYDDENGFRMDIAGFLDGAPLLEFRAIRGRTYQLMGSLNLEDWETVPFTIPGEVEEGEEDRVYREYRATDVRPMVVNPSLEGIENPPVYFKLMVQ